MQWAAATFGPGAGDWLPAAYSTLDEPLPICPKKDKHNQTRTDPHYVAAQRAVRDATILCPVQRVLEAANRSRTNRRIWSYYFTRTPSYSVNVPNASLAAIGAFHGADVPFVFGDRFELISEVDQRLASKMGCYWANFAATGDPNRGLTNCSIPIERWPAWGEDHRGAVLVLSGQPRLQQRTGLGGGRCERLLRAQTP